MLLAEKSPFIDEEESWETRRRYNVAIKERAGLQLLLRNRPLVAYNEDSVAHAHKGQ